MLQLIRGVNQSVTDNNWGAVLQQTYLPVVFIQQRTRSALLSAYAIPQHMYRGDRTDRQTFSAPLPRLRYLHPLLAAAAVAAAARDVPFESELPRVK